MAGIQTEQEQESHPDDASNLEPNPPPSTMIPALTRDKTPATSCNLLSWFRHPLAAFRASLKRRRCASSGDDNAKVVERKKKVQIVANANGRVEEMAMNQAAEAKVQQEKKVPAGNSSTIVDCLNDDDVYVKKEDMAIAGKEEQAKAKEQQEPPENVAKKWVGEPMDLEGGNKHKAAITSPNNKQPESAPIAIEEAAAAHPVATAGGCWEMNQQLAAENAEEAITPAAEDTAVSGIQEIK